MRRGTVPSQHRSSRTFLDRAFRVRRLELAVDRPEDNGRIVEVPIRVDPFETIDGQDVAFLDFNGLQASHDVSSGSNTSQVIFTRVPTGKSFGST